MGEILGHHHISMYTKNAQKNADFYRTVMGLRLVEKTVNQDNIKMYHLFYGDTTGTPGNDLTFFELPKAGKTVRGTNAISRIGLLVASYGSLVYWERRLADFAVKHGEIGTYFGYDSLPFEDPDGLQLILLNADDNKLPSFWEPWSRSAVQKEHRILGMGPVELTVRDSEKTAEMLTKLLGYTEKSTGADTAVFQAVPGEIFGEFILIEQAGEAVRLGRGGVHHVAVRVKDETVLDEFSQKVAEKGYHMSKKIDRYFFKSLYFREKNGLLIEIATDGPGFTVDSLPEELGKKLNLPPFLENRREEIESALEPIE